MLSDEDLTWLDEARESLRGSEGRVLVLTGAGISAESGIPTFRGPEGYWKRGSEVYRPEEMATASMFRQAPEEVWAWYLYRLGVCRNARPNGGHEQLLRLEQGLGDRFLLITQNVDGLHRRVGHEDRVLYEIHGNIELMRPFEDSADGHPPRPLPTGLKPLERGESLSDEHLALLRADDGSWMRPHVLWFDESYDEVNFRWDSSLRAAGEADLLIVIGTSGATNLPRHVARFATENGARIIDVNPNHNAFSDLALSSRRGRFLKGTATEVLPLLLDRLLRP